MYTVSSADSKYHQETLSLSSVCLLKEQRTVFGGRKKSSSFLLLLNISWNIFPPDVVNDASKACFFLTLSSIETKKLNWQIMSKFKFMLCQTYITLIWIPRLRMYLILNKRIILKLILNVICTKFIWFRIRANVRLLSAQRPIFGFHKRREIF
jgi:hypothetical protein